jgi:hypothetical protein
MAQLPPDLEALGDALTRAAADAVAARRHRVALRRRVAACVAAGLVVFAAMTPSHLGGGDEGRLLQQLASVSTLADGGGFGCDRPRGDGGSLPEGCDVGKIQPQAAR